ncbi:MAG TPA: LuxR C-terminal-related transcriptional regulator [Thermoanaerobaculia bacterium]|nr:LuxR C-terminal-related transcriptional regulator [Thermoanaerobaculia bacterium]
MRAIALHRSGRSALAIPSMQSALELASKPRFVRPFTVEGAPLLPLIEKAAQSIRDRTFAHAVIATITGAPKRPSPIATLDTLSDRELEVLHLIASGASNSTAAQKLFVAPSTVKKHLENIYAKLGVNGRVQAIARARDLQLL